MTLIKYRLSCLCCFLFVFLANMQAMKGLSEFRFSDFWKGEKDATPAMLRMIEEAGRKKSSTLFVEAGEYHFYPEKAFEKYCYIPNHDNGLKRSAFPLIGMENVHLKGDETKFIFHGVMVPFIIERSSNITIEGISIDWEMPLHTEVEVIAHNEAANSFDVKIPQSQPYLIRNGELVFIKEGYEHNMETGILFDRDNKRVHYNTRAYTPIPYKRKVPLKNGKDIQPLYEPFLAFPALMKPELENRLVAKELKPGIVRISGSPKELPPIGTVYACKGAGGKNRLAPAMYINRSRNINISQVNIYHAGGMGVIAEGSENIYMQELTVSIPPNSKRVVSTTADATHFLNCRGKIKFDQCLMTNQLDDATNVHGAYMVIQDVLDEHTLGVRVGHFQQQGLYFGDRGNRIGIVDQKKSVHALFDFTLEDVQEVNAGYYKLRFNETLPKTIKKGMVVENLDAYPEVNITNCTFKNNRARGILLSTPRKVVVENNYFSTMMSAVFMPVELSYWYESGHSQDVTIRNNRFVDCAYGGKNLPVIYIHTTLDHNDYVFGKIGIEGNKFEQFDAAILKANGVDALRFSNNEIQVTDTYTPLFPDNAAVSVKHIRYFEAKDNVFNGKAQEYIISDEVMDEQIED